MEQLANLYSTTLAAGYTAGAGSISVTSATGAPTAGPFCVLIRDATTKAVKLIFRVTSVSGTTFTGAAEGTDANAASGDLVDGTMVTVAALGQIINDCNRIGTFASLPSNSAGRAGMRYIPTDAVVDEYIHDGSVWQPFIAGLKLTTPATTDFATAIHGVNGTETAWADVKGGVRLAGTAASGDNIIARIKSVPATPYEYVIRYYPYTYLQDFHWVGGLWRGNGATNNRLQTVGYGQRASILKFRNSLWVDVNTYNTTIEEDGGFANSFSRGGLAHLMMGDDGTNRYIKVSTDGRNWFTIDSRAHNHDFTPNEIGLFIIPYTTTDGKCQLTCVDFTRTV